MTDKEQALRKLQDECGGYWKEHPEFPVSDWQYEVQNGDTRQGYWEFVAAQTGVIEI